MRNGNKQFFFDILCVFTLTLDTGGSHKIISYSDFLKDRIRNRSDHTDHRIRFHIHLIFVAMDFFLSIYIDQNQNQIRLLQIFGETKIIAYILCISIRLMQHVEYNSKLLDTDKNNCYFEQI